MYFKVGKEHFCYARCIRVVVAFACIQGFHGFHFFIGELEVEDVDVFFDSFLVGGFREDDESFLVFEAEDDLARVLSVFFSEVCDDGVFKEGFVSVAERVPCFEADVVFCHELTDFLLLVERVAFDLVDAWHGVELGKEFQIFSVMLETPMERILPSFLASSIAFHAPGTSPYG